MRSPARLLSAGLVHPEEETMATSRTTIAKTAECATLRVLLPTASGAIHNPNGLSMKSANRDPTSTTR